MIFKTASPISPDVEIAIDQVPVNYLSLQRISIEETENTHSLMVLDFSGLAPELISEYVDRPITVSITFPNIGGIDFVGYITFLEPTSVTKDGLVNNSSFQITRMYCMGASYLMKGKKSRAWENVTISDIAKTIADTYKFSVSVPKDSYKFPRLVQSAQSDWELLVMACTSLGYSVNVTGTHIHIWDPFKALARKTSVAYLKTIKGQNGAVTPTLGQILKFEGRIGAVTTSASRTSETLHVLDKFGKVLSVESNPVTNNSGLGNPVQALYSDTLSRNADSYEMAHKFIEGNLRRKFPITASVDITGNPTIKPGGVVKVDKYESKLDGYWYVQGVRHEITRSELVSFLKIAKDSTSEVDYSLNPVSEYTTPPPASLVNGSWVSSYNYIDIYA